ncbi:PKD domain-containing protein [Algoriphagus hitonicola]|uniref:PKD domain-containing protein n=1 Tax=Algoriphagus hitonicola TaxID=435880 RepID=UPI0015A65435|nr:PKD domain-containing protein [Algoriphagus hitonicola]
MAQISTIGREFYVGFMDNNRRNSQPDGVFILITAMENTSGVLQTPERSFPFTLVAGEQYVQQFDGDSEGVIHRESGRVEYRPVKVTSSADITVHVLNSREFSTDGTVVLPVEALSSEYLVTAHYDVFGSNQEAGSNQNYESTLLVIATADDTEVEIIPSARTVNTIPAGASIRITLNQGESYQIKGLGDLTGTSVKVMNPDPENCKLLAVFGGNKTSSAGDCGTSGDHVFQQAYPLESWGKEYIHIPFAGRTSGEIVKVLASQDQTEIFINGVFRGVINAREFTRFEFGKEEIALIQTSKPTTVSVITKSAACNEFGLAPFGDPSLVTLSSTNQLLKEISFSTGELTGSQDVDLIHFVNLVVPEKGRDETVLNGQNISDQFSPLPVASDFYYARIAVPEGVNTLSNPVGFLGNVYSSGNIESYSYAIGARLDNIQYETETEYDFDVMGDKVACLDQEGEWTILPEDPRFQIFEWDFGDSDPMKSGQTVSHIFEEEGTFTVTVFASTGAEACDATTEYVFEVEVKGVFGELQGPSSLCPFTESVQYSFADTMNVADLLWEIEGGAIVEEGDDFIRVDWGEERTDAFVQVIPIAPNGCQGEVQTIQVELLETTTPELPKGQAGLCGEGSNVLVYKVPFPLEDRSYEWIVEGGSILSGQNTTEVEVEWDLNATEKSIFYEEKVDFGDCFGVSEILKLRIFDSFSVAVDQINSPSCPGQNDGTIELTTVGGSGEVIFQWVHDSSLEGNIAEGLSAGIYEVLAIDQSGCGEQQLTIEVLDPEALSLEDLITDSTSCFEAGDGGGSMQLSGGNAPFTVLGLESSWDGERLYFSGLGRGENDVTVQDAKGCNLVVSLVIPSPEPLQLTFEEILPGCPGGIDGELEARVQGGVGPYSYLWENGGQDLRLQGLSSGEYEITVTDANGCQISGIGIVSQTKPSVRMPTGFLTTEGPYQPISNCSISYRLSIFNRWGQLLFSGQEGWDGFFEGKKANAGVYSYLLDYEYTLENGIGREQIRGSFTMIE